MKQSHLKPALLLLALLCAGCSSGGNSAAAGDAGASDKAGFSATIDGAQVEGHGTQFNSWNYAQIVPLRDSGQEIVFTLVALQPGPKVQSAYELRFNFPVKVGTYKVVNSNNDECKCDLILERANPFTRYSPDSMTFTISSLTASRITGSFAGTLKWKFDTPPDTKTSKTSVVSDGKFDIAIVKF
jgi:hypothetical protein